MVALPPPDLFELYYDGTFHNRTADVRASAGVTMSRGVSAEGTRADPSTADILLGNRHGDYSRRNPASSLYGKIGPNTPMRYSIEAGHPYLLLPGDASSALTTPDHASLGVTDLDLRIELAIDDYGVYTELASRFSTSGNNRAWSFQLPAGSLQLAWYPDGSFASQKVANAPLPVPAVPGDRIALRVVLDVDNGAGGHLVSFYWAPTIDATVWIPLGSGSDGAGTTTLIDGTAGIHLGTNTGLVGNGINGRVYAFELWDAATGVRKVSVDFSTAEAGDTSFTDPGGLVWTVAGAATLSNRHVRMAGEVPAWPPQRDLSGADRTVQITPAGITRRLDAGNKPLESAYLRFIRAAGPLECWPLTDGTQTTAATSLIAQAPMPPQFSFGRGPVQWTEGNLADWLEPVALIPPSTDATMRGLVPTTVALVSGWSVDFAVSGLVEGSIDLQVVDRGAGTDADNRLGFTLDLDPAANDLSLTVVAVGATSSSSSFLGNVAAPGIFDALPHHIRLTVQPQPGLGNSNWTIYVDGEARDGGTYAVVAKAPLSVRLGWFQSAVTSNTPSVGFITVWPLTLAAPTAETMYTALLGFQGETAGARFLRLCDEQGVPAVLKGAAADTTELGVQQRERFLDALASIARADGGYVLEQRADRALLYRTRASLYNQPPALTLDFSTGVISEPFRPLDDEKLTENDVTVTREGGTFGQASRETIAEGPNSVEAIGRYDVAHTLSLADDSQALQQAGWRLHVGTVDGLRYPQITLDLGNPRVWPLIRDIYLADVGDKIRLTNLPDDHGPDDVDLLIRGYKETVTEKKWTVTFTCTPAGPYDVLQLDALVYGRLDTDGTTLGTGVSSSATSMQLVSDPGPGWITTATHPTEFPFDVVIGGERVTVTGITAGALDAFGRTVASGWGSADTGGAWTSTGGSAADYAVGSGVGSHTLATVNVSRRSTITSPAADFDLYVTVAASAVATGASIFGGLIARVAGPDDLYYARAEFTTAGAVILAIRERAAGVESTLATFTTPYTYTAGAQFRLRFQTAGTTLRARVWPVASGEPTEWQVSTTDSTLTAAGSIGCRSILATGNTNVSPVVRYDNLLMANPQLATVTRSVNGVVKAHAAGADIRLAQPMALAL